MDILNPFLKNKEPLSLEECVNRSFLNKKTKKSTLSLINKYTNYCNNETKIDIINYKGQLNPSQIKTVYDPKNAYDFVVSGNNYNRSSVKKNLNTLLRYLRLATKNPYLSYDLPIGIGEPVKLKHIISDDELQRFVKFLNAKRLYILIVMCMIMFKFGLRIGALSKLRDNDLLPNGIIIFREKNNNII